MEIFLGIVLYILIVSVLVLSEYLVNHAYYKEPLELIHRRRKNYLLKTKANKEYTLWILQQKNFNTPEKVIENDNKISKLQREICKILNELNDIEDYLNIYE